MLGWLFGTPDQVRLHLSEPRRMAGFIEFEKAKVRWFLSVNQADLPSSACDEQVKTYRSITVDGREIEFSGGFTDLHTRVYEKVLAGEGFGIEDARPSVELSHRIRTSELSFIDELAHPLLYEA